MGSDCGPHCQAAKPSRKGDLSRPPSLLGDRVQAQPPRSGVRRRAPSMVHPVNGLHVRDAYTVRCAYVGRAGCRASVLVDGVCCQKVESQRESGVGFLVAQRADRCSPF